MMEGFPENDSVTVVVIFDSKSYPLNCEVCLTMTQVRDAWYDNIGASPPVAFFTTDNRCLPEDCTVSQALIGSATPEVLLLRGALKSTIKLEVFGYEDSLTALEVASISTPAAVRRQIGEAVGIFSDDYRLSCNGIAIDPEQPFGAQGVSKGAKLTVDMRLTVNLDAERPEGGQRRTLSCFGSQTVGDLRQEVGLQDDEVLVATREYRRVLSDTLHLCHVVSDVMDLHLPMDLASEKKVLLGFEPIMLPHRRQKVAVALSAAPLDLYEMLSARFEMTAEFQLAVDGQALEKHRPLIEQCVDNDTVIQIDILRLCKVEDQWADLRESRCDDLMFLYSTESSAGLFLKDFTNEQTLKHDGFDLTVLGAMLDIFGVITGQHKSLILVDRDVERSLPILSFDAVTRRQAWARNLMLDVVPLSHGLRPKEVMSHGDLIAAKSSLKQLCLSGDSLIVLDPMKIVVREDKEWDTEEGKKKRKRLHIHRFARGCTGGDVLARMRQQKKCYDLGVKVLGRPIADEPISPRMDLKLYLLASESRFRTKLTVSLDGTSFGCWFLADKVGLKDIFIQAGKQAKVSPRTLFRHELFCVGCGRKMTQEEEAFQSVPSDCCRVRSLELTDRRGKEVGVQSAVPRQKDKETEMPRKEERDASTQTGNQHPCITLEACKEMPPAINKGAVPQILSDRQCAMRPATRTAGFQIGWFFDERDSFNFDLKFDPPLLGRRLKVEIARRRGVLLSMLELKQRRARRRADSASLVLSGNWSWRDQKDGLVNDVDVKGLHSHVIEDEEEVPLAGDQVTWILVHKAENK